jgi:hypothetical protein
MKIEMVKQPGGILAPATDEDSEALSKFKTGEQYQIEIKRARNPAFHRKTFAFFKFCFEHWSSDREFMNERGQFDVFRNNLTVLAGFYTEYYNLKGEVRIEAKSLSFGSMSQDEFEQHYQALIAAAMRNIFKGCDSSVENQLLSFF